MGNEGVNINSDTSPVSSHHRVESPGKNSIKIKFLLLENHLSVAAKDTLIS